MSFGASPSVPRVSFDDTIESLEGYSETESDLEHFKVEAKSFASSFRGQAFTTAERGP